MKINTHAQSDGTSHSNVRQDNFVATVPPVETNDDTEGYDVGSKWWVGDLKKLFVCFDPETDSAVWKLISSNGLVTNKTGGTLGQLYVVQPDTPQGNSPTVKLAKADTEADSSDTIGVILEDIADNAKGYILDNANIYNCDSTGATFGEVWNDGELLWLSATTAGYMTKTKPAAPNHAVIIGTVINSHLTEGIIQIKIYNGWETYELHDVNDTPATVNEFHLHDGSIFNPTNFDTEVSANADVVANTTHRSSDGKDHSDVVLNNTHRTGNGDDHTTSYAPIGIEFGNTTQSYDVDGTTWVAAVAGGTLGGIPDETSSGHELSACLAAIATAVDGSYLAVREASGAASATNPLTVQFLFTSVTEFNFIDMRSQYNGGAGHILGLELWDYVNSAFVRIKRFTDQTFFEGCSCKVFGDTNFVGTGGDAGKVLLQIIHDNAGNTGHNIQFDYVKLYKGL
jgi:hypothetical protein